MTDAHGVHLCQCRPLLYDVLCLQKSILRLFMTVQDIEELICKDLAAGVLLAPTLYCRLPLYTLGLQT